MSLDIITFYGVPLAVGFIIAVGLTYLVRQLAVNFRVVDQPNARKVHIRPIPLLGGLAVFLSVVVCIGLFWNQLQDGVIVAKYLIGIILGGAVIMLGGSLDDKFNLKPYQQIIFPVIAALIVIASGIGIRYITNPFGGYIHFDEWKILLFWWDGMPYYFTVLADTFTFIWLLGMMYVTKLLDGLDGLASGIGVVGSIIIFIVSLYWDVAQSATSILALILAGSLLGFLIWNWHPAKIFLGEGGSVFIGFMLGILAIISGGKIATALLIMGIPILDVLWVIIRRLFFDKQPIAKADRKHLHHRLLDIGFTHRQAVGLLYVITAIFGLSAVFQGTVGKIRTMAIMVIFMAILAYYLVYRYKRYYSQNKSDI